jgi:hypothetical protein
MTTPTFTKRIDREALAPMLAVLYKLDLVDELSLPWGKDSGRDEWDMALWWVLGQYEVDLGVD